MAFAQIQRILSIQVTTFPQKYMRLRKSLLDNAMQCLFSIKVAKAHFALAIKDNAFEGLCLGWLKNLITFSSSILLTLYLKKVWVLELMTFNVYLYYDYLNFNKNINSVSNILFIFLFLKPRISLVNLNYFPFGGPRFSSSVNLKDW